MIKIMQTVENLPFTLTVQDIADILGINRNKAYNLSHREDFPSIQLGRRIIIERNLFFEWLEENCKNHCTISDV